MSTTRIHAAVIGVAATAVLCGSTLAGCSITREDSSQTKSSSDGAPSSATPSSGPSDGPSTGPSASTTSSAPTASATTTAIPEPVNALLAASELPPLNATSPWTERHTAPAGQQAFGLCQKFDLLSIGALSVVERTYSSRTDRAGQQVADFPDAQNAVRASKVFEAWQRSCARRVKGTSVKVRPTTAVAVPRGLGWWYLVSFERRGTGHFHSFGLVRSGARVTVLRMDHQGQDHNYDPGMDPMELAVKAAAARLG